MAEKLWRRMTETDYVAAWAMTGGQAADGRAGLEAIYLSGWQVAADANLAEQVYPDQSLYPATSALTLAADKQRLRRADRSPGWAHLHRLLAPIVADGEAGFEGR